MGNPIWHNIHPDFKLNGTAYNLDGVRKLANELTLSTSPYEQTIGAFLKDWTSDESVLNVRTSGSTGAPKTIQLKKEHMVNSAEATGHYFGLRSKHSALLCLPCTGIAGKMMLVRAMVLGLSLDHVEPSSTPLSAQEQDYDFVAMVPLQVQNSLDKLQRIKKLIIGGAVVDSNLREKLQEIPVEAYETYGMTETITHIAVKHINGEQMDYFETLPHVSVTKDERECLVIQAPKVSDEKVVTNDLVDILDAHRFKWVGRYDSVVNSGGIKLIPEQIEKKLSSLIASRFFVAGQPDAALGQKLILIIEADSVDKENLFQQMKRLPGLSKYEIPKQIYGLQRFPETKTQKIDRKKILEQLS